MASFHFMNEQVSIRDDHDQRVNLNPQEALDLLQWLSVQRNVLSNFIHGGIDESQTDEKRLEIHLYEDHFDHLDTLKAAIPGLQEMQEHKPAIKVLSTRWDLVTEHALQLLKDLQVEYKIHPLLEDNDTFAQA